MMDLQPNKVEVNGVGLHYVEAGAGDPVLFVHGGMSDFRTWAQQVGPFAERHRAVALSMRHHHPNEWTGDASDYLPETHAKDVAALIEALALAPVHLVTSSYGSDIGLLVARERPDLLRTLVLGEPVLSRWSGNAVVDAFWEPAQQAFRAGDREKAARLFASAALGDGAYDRLPEASRRRVLDNIRLVTAPQSGTDHDFTREDAAALKPPTLVLRGDRSPESYLATTGELERLIPRAEPATVPSASHLLHAMNAPAYNETVLAFIARH
jgi:non-heme chloroperoxidase